MIYGHSSKRYPTVESGGKKHSFPLYRTLLVCLMVAFSGLRTPQVAAVGTHVTPPQEKKITGAKIDIVNPDFSQAPQSGSNPTQPKDSLETATPTLMNGANLSDRLSDPQNKANTPNPARTGSLTSPSSPVTTAPQPSNGSRKRITIEGSTLSQGTLSAPGEESRGQRAIAYPKWWPLCLFIDPTAVSEREANKTIAGLTKDAAACHVNLKIWPITIKSNYIDNAAYINQQTQKACDIISAGIAPKASVSACVKYTKTAGEMCGEVPKEQASVDGCAEVQHGATKGKTKAQIKKLFGGEGKEAATGMPAPSIERLGACTARTVGHEAIGHSQAGNPNLEPGKPDAGNGIMATFQGSQGGPGGVGWTNLGCNDIYANALNNDGRWTYNPKRTQYYRHKKWRAQFDINSSRKLFGGGHSPRAPSNLQTPSPTTLPKSRKRLKRISKITTMTNTPPAKSVFVPAAPYAQSTRLISAAVTQPALTPPSPTQNTEAVKNTLPPPHRRSSLTPQILTAGTLTDSTTFFSLPPQAPQQTQNPPPSLPPPPGAKPPHSSHLNMKDASTYSDSLANAK